MCHFPYTLALVLCLSKPAMTCYSSDGLLQTFSHDINFTTNEPRFELNNQTENGSLSLSGVHHFKNICIAIRSVVFFVGVPVNCLAAVALISLRKISPGLIFVINLLVLEVIQVSIRCIFVAKTIGYYVGASESFCDPFKVCFKESPVEVCCAVEHLALYSMIVAVCFMVCISVERYIKVVFPLWYYLHNMVTISIILSVLNWLIGAVLMSVANDPPKHLILYPIAALLPIPLFTIFSVGTWKILSQSQTVVKEEKKKIMGLVKLVLVSYFVLFSPYSFLTLLQRFLACNENLALARETSIEWAYMSAVVDPFVYIFSRKDVKERYNAFRLERGFVKRDGEKCEHLILAVAGHGNTPPTQN